MDITIKNLPDGIEEQVKEMIAVAVQRHFEKDIQPPNEVLQQFKTNVDTFREANELEKKFPAETETETAPKNIL